MTWRCVDCGLPDPYHGGGDGIGSCECPRCDCCSGAPDECDCSRDFDPYIDDEDAPFDPLCNDTSCEYRRNRLAARDTYTEASHAMHEYYNRSWGY